MVRPPLAPCDKGAFFMGMHKENYHGQHNKTTLLPRSGDCKDMVVGQE
jgi:hypothetical protein